MGNLAQAARSDDSLRARVSDAAEGILSVLDPVNLATATPALRAPMVSTAEDGDLVATLRTALEDLEAVGAERAGIEDTMRQIKEKDNIMSKVMAKTCDDYEPLFAEELAKYDQVKGAIANNVSSQSDILSRLRDTHARFVSAYDVPGWRSAMASHAEVVRGAVAHYRELSSGIDRGLTFYSGFAQATQQLGADCEGFAANRRAEKRDLETAVAHRAQQAAAMAEHHAAASAAQHRAAADQAAAQRSFAEAQASMQARSCSGRRAKRASSFGAAPQPSMRASTWGSTPIVRGRRGCPRVRTPRTTPRGIPSHRPRTRDISTARRSPRNRRCRTARGRLSPRPRRKGHTCTRRPRTDTAGKARRRPRSSSNRRAGAIPGIHRNETCALKEYI